MDKWVVATQIFLELSPRSLGKSSNLTSIFFKGVGSTTNKDGFGKYHKTFLVHNWWSWMCFLGVADFFLDSTMGFIAMCFTNILGEQFGFSCSYCWLGFVLWGWFVTLYHGKISIFHHHLGLTWICLTWFVHGLYTMGFITIKTTDLGLTKKTDGSGNPYLTCGSWLNLKIFWGWDGNPKNINDKRKKNWTFFLGIQLSRQVRISTDQYGLMEYLPKLGNIYPPWVLGNL